MNEKEILKIAAKALDDKKAKDLTALQISDLTVLCDYFLIATATSSTHVHALSDEVHEKLSENGVTPHHIEGRATGWILLDYGCVVVHVFTPEAREYYNLEKLWADGEVVDISSLTEE